MLTPIPILDEPFYRTGLAQIGFLSRLRLRYISMADRMIVFPVITRNHLTRINQCPDQNLRNTSPS
jgi:hypothetical protein